ncbi:MAG: Spy/CpxP family protein refolding chaperone [bacterium]
MKAIKTIVVLGIFLISTAFVKGELIAKAPQKRHQKIYRELELFSDELELTEEQQAMIKAERLRTGKETIELRAKIKIAELELRQLLQNEEPDENQIKAKIEEIGGLKTELRFMLVKSHFEVQNILSPEQLEKLKSLKKEIIMKRKYRRFRQRRPRSPFEGNNELPEPGENFNPELYEFEGELTEI